MTRAERDLLFAFFAAVRAFDPDALIGWNVINFDLRYLAGRCERAGLKLDLGIDGPADLIEPEGGGAYGRFGSNWLALDRMGGSVAALDFLYLPKLHRAG